MTMTKENIYIDLSKCSDDELKHIFSLLPEENDESQYAIFKIFKYLNYDEIAEYWFVGDGRTISKKTELTYPEFIKLFDGEEDGNNGWIKVESEEDLPKLKIGEIIHCFIKSSDYENVGMGVFSQITNSFLTHFHNHYENVTHYQPIKKPLPPKF